MFLLVLLHFLFLFNSSVSFFHHSYQMLLLRHQSRLIKRYSGLHPPRLQVTAQITSSQTSNFDDIKKWKDYYVEFRGIQPYYRIEELKCALNYYLMTELCQEPLSSLAYETVIPDFHFPSFPFTILTKFPSDKIASLIAKRSCTTRIIFDCWAKGNNIQELKTELSNSYEEKIKTLFNAVHDQAESTQKKDLTWNVQFRHPGRIKGYDNQEKNNILSQFGNMLDLIEEDYGVKVKLHNATYEFVYYENWSHFHRLIDEGKTKESIFPSFSAFGRILGKGPEISTMYDTKKRPFAGATTMNPFISHIGANFALSSPLVALPPSSSSSSSSPLDTRLSIDSIVPNCTPSSTAPLVLDPFCGSGSLLIPAAYLGSDVVASDIYPLSVPAVATKQQKKQDWKQQHQGNEEDIDSLRIFPVKDPGIIKKKISLSSNLKTNSLIQNFEFYHLQGKLQGLHVVDIVRWLVVDEREQSLGCHEKVTVYSSLVGCCFLLFFCFPFLKVQFDAIITDPPFGKRESFVSQSLEMETLSLSDDHVQQQVTGKQSCTTSKKKKAEGDYQFYFLWKKIEKEFSNFNTSLLSLLNEQPVESVTNSVSTSDSNKHHKEERVNKRITDDDARILSSLTFHHYHYPYEVIALLFLLTKVRLKEGGRLVFWLPTKSFLPKEVIESFLLDLMNYLEKNYDLSLHLSLKFVGQEELNTAMWRWCCVLEKKKS
jgi:tRNA G10  N-methylase Trm11